MIQRIHSKVKDIQLSEVLHIQDSGKMGISIQLYYQSMMHQLRNFRSGSIGCANLTYCQSLKFSRTGSMIVGIKFSIMHQYDPISGTLNPYSIPGKPNFLKTSPSLLLSLFIMYFIGRTWRSQ